MNEVLKIIMKWSVSAHNKQSEMMASELQSRSSALEQLRNDQVESTKLVESFWILNPTSEFYS